MGLVNRKKSGRILNGSKMVVDGQGVSTSNKPTPFTNEKMNITPSTNTKSN